MNEKMLSELKERITTLSTPEFEDVANFVFHQGKERSAGINKFMEDISWRVDPRHEDMVN